MCRWLQCIKNFFLYTWEYLEKIFNFFRIYFDKILFFLIEEITSIFGVELKEQLINAIIDGFWETIIMVTFASFFAFIFGLPIGIILATTKKDHIAPNKAINAILGFIVNFGRSVPFIILMIFLIPITKYLVGSSIGTKAAIIPLIIGATPFIARLIETAILEVDERLIEAAQACGANNFQIVYKVLIPEAKAGIISALTVTVIALVGYSAMAGAVGGGGLGDIAIRYGYNRFIFPALAITVIILYIIVEIIQNIGDYISKRLTH